MDIAGTLKDAVDSGAVPGVAAAAATDKGVIFEGGAGMLRPDSVIWIASMTKAVTAAAAMQLVERRKLSLDAPASDVVPELGSKGVLEGFDKEGKAITRNPQRPITLRHLLTHTSGLGYDTWNADIMKYRQATGIPAVGSCQNAALTTPLLAEPGERWEYGISIDWAGKMVEAASGQRLDRYMTERLFVPLGMSDTGFAIGPAQRLRKARMHTRGPGGFTVMEHEIPQTPEFHMGGGGLYSTVSDYLKFTQALLMGGGPILKPETVKLMAQNHMAEGVLCRPLKSQLPHMSTDLDFVDGMKWGLSFMINPTAFPGRRSADSLTWGGLANSYYWIDPAKKVTGVWATQLLPFYDPRAIAAFENFERAVYASL
ncbi:MAG: beta-lactamase family protein [Reyranella sp.]|uniref:serine hydrolase domain-containing protein n=1 Tax=Reyranella sp. TaxID=1929291 RepID=UPI001AD2DCEE|nr:serine hydrolase domain-containing protein [Reyranella sp.]MBN9090296.1 beta-lactamase family protein [Reyranella sp.]